jgi:molecular chaperone DnaK
MSGGLAIGIDLGTTTSLAAVCMPDGQPRLLRDRRGNGIIPSVVSILPDGRALVGQAARDRMVIDPDHTFFSTKRFIGRDMRQEENEWAAADLPYAIAAGEHGVPTVEAHGRRYTLTDLAAMILAHLREVATEATGLPVQRAVVTVPANFNEVQRAVTREAGERAGLEVLRILNEPTAAALAYGLGSSENRRVAVYDFGGGTFDMSVLEMREPIYEVLSTAGNTMLGGDDFDRRILDMMIRSFEERFGVHPKTNREFLQKMFLAAERIKCQLSDWLVAGFTERAVDLGGGRTVDYHFELSREDFNLLCADLVDGSFRVCDDALEQAGGTLTAIDEVILVGGTTRIPLLRDRVTRYFLRPPLERIQPDLVVALGAAIQASGLGGGAAMWSAAGLHARAAAVPPADATAMVDARALAQAARAAAVPADPATAIVDAQVLAQATRAAAAPARPAEPPTAMVDARALARAARAAAAPADSPAAEIVDGTAIADALLGGAPAAPPTPPPLPKPSSPSAWMRESRFGLEPPEGLGLPAQAKPPTAIAAAQASPPPGLPSAPRTAAPPLPAAGPVPPPLPSAGPAPVPLPAAEAGAPSPAPLVHEAIASIQAGHAAAPRPAPVLLDVTPMTLGVQTVGGNVEPIIRRNTTVPTEKSRLFGTTADDQTTVLIRVCQGESRKAAENVLLGELALEDLPAATRGDVTVKVTFELDVDGILKVTAVDNRTGRRHRVRMTLYGG